MSTDAPSPTRNEHDLLGDRAVPASVYWGVHTLRAVENFPISGQTVATAPDLVNALATSNGVGAPLPLTAVVLEMLTALEAGGHEGEDHSGLVQYFEALAKTSVATTAS